MPLVIGSIFTAFGFINLYTIPHPLWFFVASSLSYIPSALLGASLAYPRRVPNAKRD